MMIYFAILPQFMDHTRPVGLQALVLSAIFVALCGIVYTIVSVAIASIDKKSGFSDRRRRCVEGTAGCLLIVAAGRLAAN
jgi:threonine/homoserine/homoserine lactone efflux protein